MRYKLIDLLAYFGDGYNVENRRICATVGEVADYLIENGVVIIDPKKYPPVTGRDLISTIMGVPLDEVAALIKERENGKSKQSDWISVEDRMPDREGTYLVYTWKGHILMCNCYDYLLDGDLQFDNYNVTHWMPLPEAPKGGE